MFLCGFSSNAWKMIHFVDGIDALYFPPHIIRRLIFYKIRIDKTIVFFCMAIPILVFPISTPLRSIKQAKTRKKEPPSEQE